MRRSTLVLLSLAWAAPAAAQPPAPAPPPSLTLTPPDVVPAVSEPVWQMQRRRLKVQTAVSWTFAAIGLAGVAVPLALLSRCPDDRSDSCRYAQGALIAAPIFGALAVASLVPAVIFTDRLVHHQRPERVPRLGLGPGGLVLRF